MVISIRYSYINRPTAHVFNTTEGWTVCFHSSLLHKPIWRPWVLRWLSNNFIFSWQADSRLWFTTKLDNEFSHGFSCFVWHVEVNMAVICLFLCEDVAIALHFVAPHPVPTIQPYRSTSGIGYTKLSKMVDNSATYIQCTVYTFNYFEYLYTCGERCAGTSNMVHYRGISWTGLDQNHTQFSRTDFLGLIRGT